MICRQRKSSVERTNGFVENELGPQKVPGVFIVFSLDLSEVQDFEVVNTTLRVARRRLTSR